VTYTEFDKVYRTGHESDDGNHSENSNEAERIPVESETAEGEIELATSIINEEQKRCTRKAWGTA